MHQNQPRKTAWWNPESADEMQTTEFEVADEKKLQSTYKTQLMVEWNSKIPVGVFVNIHLVPWGTDCTAMGGGGGMVVVKKRWWGWLVWQYYGWER